MPLVIGEGNRVEITLDREEKTTSYISVVENICEDDLVMIHMPISYGSLVKLPMDINYKMIFYTERGLFKYNAKIVKYVSEGAFKFMLVKLCSEAEKFQRREFFRFECILEFKFDKLDENENEFEFDDLDINLDGLMKDISAGGVRFVTNESFDVGDMFKCRINLNGDEIVSSAKIIQIESYVKANYKFQYRAEFLSITESDRDLIIKYIFNEQRKIAKYY